MVKLKKHVKVLSPHDEMVVGEMGKTMANLFIDIWNAGAASSLGPEEDMISQTKAEAIFGKRWLKQHTDHYGERLFVQAVGAKNCRKRYSLKELTRIRMEEATSPSAMGDFLIGVQRQVDGAIEKERNKTKKHTR